MTTGMNLYTASNQWATRPPDERFASIQEMYDATKRYAVSAREAQVPFADIRVERVHDDLHLVGKTGVPAKLTHYVFGQICRVASAPANYLRTLPATLAAQNINHGLAARSEDAANDAKLLFHQNGDLVLRALTTDRYERIWNWEMVQRLQGLQDQGWQVPPARPVSADQPGARKATEADVLIGKAHGLSIRVGDDIAPAGLYASDHDMFAFMVYEKNRINNGTPNGLARGVFFSNSEVGNGAIIRVTFLYEYVCGNHIVWNASGVQKLKVEHTGKALRDKLQVFTAELTDYADASAKKDEAAIRKAQRTEIAATKEGVLTEIFRLRIPNLRLDTIEAAYDVAEEFEKESKATPNSVYGMVHGLTRVSQDTDYADQRNAIDVAAGKVMQIAF
jgi:hypothetical protein